MLESLDQLEAAAMRELGGVTESAGLEAWRIAYLGAKGKLRAAMAGLKDVPKDQKPAAGARLNAVKSALETAFASRRAALGTGEAAAGPRVDLTEPGLMESAGPGRRHILSRVREELVEVFARMGFGVAQGPELEDDEHNFVRLNIPASHPAREPSENYYVRAAGGREQGTGVQPLMLRSQTSTVQVRTMETRKPPIRVIAPGRVYRPDTVDATHHFMFHQIEGLAVDRGLSMADLSTTLFQFARAYFGGDARVRLRPSYFPFTEPSAEFDLWIALRPGDAPRWMELGGCGMVDPAVLTACGIDPERWSGFAFGFGIDRLAMGKYRIPDIRLLTENDLRFLGAV